jgi:hypothetical protein
MHESGARNLRNVERFLIVPPLSALFGKTPVAVSDISSKGGRFRHEAPLETGAKGSLKISEGRVTPLLLEAVIVWTQQEPDGRYVSGVRTYGSPSLIDALLAQLHAANRSNRIEELRSSDRFLVSPLLDGTFGEVAVKVRDISARGARIEHDQVVPGDQLAMLRFQIPSSAVNVEVMGRVVWSAVKSLDGGSSRYHSGLFIRDKPELMRLAIGQLSETNRATLDTSSLRLKLRILKARARELAPSYQSVETGGIPAEQYLLIQGVREELRLNPEEAQHWYRRARISINDPATRAIAPPIADHPDALAVWEYLDRSIDPGIVSRAFQIVPR